MATLDKYLLVAAIDFGTTFSGYACSFRSSPDQPNLHEQIRMNKNWGEELGCQVSTDIVNVHVLSINDIPIHTMYQSDIHVESYIYIHLNSPIKHQHRF